MGVVSKLKFIFKAAKPVGKFVDQIKGAKLKYKTIPFWIAVVGDIAAIAGAIKGLIPATVSVLVIGGLTALYNFLRGLDKMNQEGIKPAVWSTEFWVGILGLASAAIVDLQTAGVSGPILTSILGFIGTAMTIAQNLGAQQPEDVKKAAE